MVAAAIVGGAIIGGVATNMAAGKAASATSAGAQGGASSIRSSTATALKDVAAGTKQGVGTLQKAGAGYTPYQKGGTMALTQLETLLGFKGGKGAALKKLEATPGYQFAQSQGDQATINAATATGMNLSGNTLEDLSKFNQGLATSTYNTQVGNLENLVGTGLNATGGAAGVASGEASLEAGGATTEANLLADKGTAIANVDIGQGTNLANIGMATAASDSALASSAANDFLLTSLSKDSQTPQAVDGGDYYADDTLKRFKPCRN